MWFVVFDHGPVRRRGVVFGSMRAGAERRRCDARKRVSSRWGFAVVEPKDGARWGARRRYKEKRREGKWSESTKAVLVHWRSTKQENKRQQYNGCKSNVCRCRLGRKKVECRQSKNKKNTQRKDREKSATVNASGEEERRKGKKSETRWLTTSSVGPPAVSPFFFKSERREGSEGK